MSRLSAALLVVTFAWPAMAQGDPSEDPPTDPPAPDPAPDPAPAPAPDPAPASAPAPPRFPIHFLFGNGLSLLLTRLSVGYELLPVAHHSFGLSIYGQYGGLTSEIGGVKGAFVGAGGEVGYRFYAWRNGPFGPFFGVSFLAGYYHTQARISRIDPDAFRFAQYGPAADFGWSVPLDRTTVVALSLGAQYTFTDVASQRLPDLTRLLVGDGPRPRAGIQVGKIF